MIDLDTRKDSFVHPLTLEEAIAMAPSHPPTPTFIASTGAIAWGAVRSGISVWQYIIGMTQEFEANLQAAYEVWKAENAWYREAPDASSVASSANSEGASTENVKAIMASMATTETDADVDIAATAPIEATEDPCATPVDAIPTVALDEPQSTKKPGSKEIPTPMAMDDSESTDGTKTTPRKKVKKNANTMKPAAQDAIMKAIADLPKEPDPALYASILSTTDRDTLKAAIELFIEKKKRIHRSRSAQAAFLKWLEEAIS